MRELLSPAGTIEAFHAAISNGANAIYLGLDRFSARAYANNFTLDNLKPLVEFAHLRNVKIFVTINTIIYDEELKDAYQTIDELAKIGIDGIIIQDLAIANYIIKTYKSLPAHASTQMGVDDLDAAALLKKMGFKRIVFARETPIPTIKKIKQTLGIEVETFIHGALCVSYSGNCYMSSAIGERSGNRGRCAGCCRKYYSLINTNNKTVIEDGYLLSMKDLNVSTKLSELEFVDSLKIEGRMKEPTYVAGVTQAYRKLLDKEFVEKDQLNKVFNRTYTQGFMNGSDSTMITNIDRPNNFGYLIGTVIKQNYSTIWVRLSKSLSKGDQVRIETKNKKEEISLPILKLFDNNFHPLDKAEKIAVFTCQPKVEVGAKVYKTKDIEFVKEMEKTTQVSEYNKIPISISVNISENKPILLNISYQNINIFVKSQAIIEEAKTVPSTKEDVIKQLSKLNDTPYVIKESNVEISGNCFVPVKTLNELRREAINKLNQKRLLVKVSLNKSEPIKPKEFHFKGASISVEVTDEEQYDVVTKLGVECIYYKNKVRRNHITYPQIEGEVLANGLGGINHYQNTNPIVSDVSLNITNHESVAILSSLGVNRITLSQEINKERIINLIKEYKETYNTDPNLELVVYGREKIMHSLYCPLKRLSRCGECKKSSYALKDDYASFPLLFNEDCSITLLNSKPLNIMDDVIDLDGISSFRLVFTNESKEEIERIIKAFLAKLDGSSKKALFNHSLYTKGHFINNPL